MKEGRREEREERKDRQREREEGREGTKEKESICVCTNIMMNGYLNVPTCVCNLWYSSIIMKVKVRWESQKEWKR